MKITKSLLRKIIKEERQRISESYNSMSPRSQSLANAAKRKFAKDYPDVKVGIDGREGWITVNGKKAVNMSSASSSPISMDDIIDQMKQAYLGHNMEDKYAVLPAADDPAEMARHKAYRDSIRLPEGRMKITKRQLKRIIAEEKARMQLMNRLAKRLQEEHQGYDAREDERLGAEHGAVANHDLDGDHAEAEHSRRDDAGFEKHHDDGSKVVHVHHHHHQGYDDREDERLAAEHGAEKDYEQSLKDRRDDAGFEMRHESRKIRITKRQLLRIIREEKTKIK